MNFFNFMKESRENAKLTQENAAKMIGVSINTIQNWEKSKLPTLSKEIIKKIIETYKIDVTDFWYHFSNEITPYDEMEIKTEIPYDILPKHYGDVIKNLKLTELEQRLLGMLYIYSIESLKCDDIIECFNYDRVRNALKTLPCNFIEKYEPFTIFSTCVSLFQKINVFGEEIAFYCAENPSTIFNSEKVNKFLLLDMLNLDFKIVKDVLETLQHSQEGNFVLFEKGNGVIKNKFDTEVFRTVNDILSKYQEIDSGIQEMLTDMFGSNCIEGNLIEKLPENITDIEEAFDKISFLDNNGMYIKAILDKENEVIRLTPTEKGIKLVKWLNNEI